MKKKGLFLGVFYLYIAATTVYGSVRPVATLALGADVFKSTMNQNIGIILPFRNAYVGNLTGSPFLGGLFLGIDHTFSNHISAQLGLGYYRTNPITATGQVYQFANPAFNNLSYQYTIQSQRLLLEGKILTNWIDKLHPFLSAGLGLARNKAYGYEETPLASYAIPMNPGFNNRTSTSFSYLWGLGIEKQLSVHFRLGGEYRWVDLNQISLGTTPLQDSLDTLNNNRLHANELLVHISYVG